jgi:hypothetical protein
VFYKKTAQIKLQYDTIITLPTKNVLIIEFLHILKNIIKSDYQINEYLFQTDAEFIYEDYVDWSKIYEENSDNYKSIEKEINKSFIKMRNKNKGHFSYKYINNKELYQYIKATPFTEMSDYPTIKHAPYINDKNVLVLDNSVLNNNKIPHSVKYLTNIYVPKSLTVITLFSKL